MSADPRRLDSFTDLEACEHDAEEGHYKIQELVRIGAELSDPQLRLENFEEMYYIDQDSRERIRFLVDRKVSSLYHIFGESEG